MKTKFLILFFVNLFLNQNFIYGQTYEWAHSFGANSQDGSYSITTDNLGNVYTTGEFRGTVDFDPGPETHNITMTGGLNTFVHKMDSDGNFLWVKTFKGGASAGNSIILDNSGNIYTIGYFTGIVDFDSGDSTFNLSSLGELWNGFVHKMDSNGNFLWVKSLEGLDRNFCQSISLDNFGNLYITGYFEDTVDFDPGTETHNLTSLGEEDIFVLKLDGNGNFLWVKSFGSSSNDSGRSISSDVFGNIYTSGIFDGTVDFDPGSGVYNLTPEESQDGGGFVLKMDTNGNFIWAKAFGSGVTSNALSSSGYIYTCGSFSGTVDLDPSSETSYFTSAGYSDVFIQKMDTNGNFIWAKSFGGNHWDGSTKIVIDNSENIYTSGTFRSIADFNPGAEIYNLTSNGYSDVYIQKMDDDGNFLWAISFGGSSTDRVRSLTIDTFQNVYSCGTFEGTADLDPSSETSYFTSAGNTDGFVQKISPVPLSVNDNNFNFKASIFPNPFSDILNIELSKPINDATLTLTDIKGSIVYTKPYNILFHTSIEFHIPKGIYFLTIEASKSLNTIKLLKN